jgi:tRNA U34 5-carboxymethylaminomethyl modifying GTPase MnmE/TrmE
MNSLIGNIKRNIETLLQLLIQMLILLATIKFSEEKNYTNSTKKSQQHLSTDPYQEIKLE